MAGYNYRPGRVERGKIRPADADRDRVAEVLNTAYVEGRLSRDEHDARLNSALSAQGTGLALAGLILGWATVILGIIAIALFVVTTPNGGIAPPSPHLGHS